MDENHFGYVGTFKYLHVLKHQTLRLISLSLLNFVLSAIPVCLACIPDFFILRVDLIENVVSKSFAPLSGFST